MVKKLSILTLLLCLSALTAAAQQNFEISAPFIVARQFNDCQVEAYKNPNKKDKVDACKPMVITGSPAEQDFEGMINRYINRGPDAEHPVHLETISHHKTRIDGQIVYSEDGSTATIKTLEDIYWVSSSGNATILTDVPETYTVNKAADGWRVYDNKFELADGTPVQWKSVVDKSWSWNGCYVTVLPEEALSLVTNEQQDDGNLLVEQIIIRPTGEPYHSQERRRPGRGTQMITNPELDSPFPWLFERNCADAIKHAEPGKEIPADVLKLFRGQYGLGQQK